MVHNNSLNNQSAKSSIKKNIVINSTNGYPGIGFFSIVNIRNIFNCYFLINLGENTNPIIENIFLDNQNFLNNSYKVNTNLSGFGFTNNWVSVNIKKGAESWGAGEDMELALSKYSEPYNYFQLKSDYGRVRVKYIHGYLEKTNDQINRYVNARGIEWTNKKSILVGISETVIYSGYNRSFDIGYLNPISSHLEIELNNRLNVVGTKSSNAVWQIHLDFLLREKIRVSINYLFDEFVLDPTIEIGKEHGRAHSLRLSYTLIDKKNNYLNLYGKNIFVGTPTFRHGFGENNFVQNSAPIGFRNGSDLEEILVGLNYSNKSSLIFNLHGGLNRFGDENIKNRVFDPYADYLKGSFPSGTIRSSFFINSKTDYKYNSYINLGILLNITSNKLIQYGLDIDFTLPMKRKSGKIKNLS